MAEHGIEGDGTIELARVRRLMFVCLGNICRSPLAQGVFEHLADRRGVRNELTIASCGTGHWHIGDPPDARSIAVAREHGVTLRSRGRQLDGARDRAAFDLFIAMDRANRRDVMTSGIRPERVRLLLEFAGAPSLAAHPDAARTLEVPDPYHGGKSDFEQAYRLVYVGAEGLLDAIFGPTK